MGETLEQLRGWNAQREAEDERAREELLTSMRNPVLPELRRGQGLETISFTWSGYKAHNRLMGSDVCLMGQHDPVYNIFGLLVRRYGYQRVDEMACRKADDSERREFFQPVYEFYEQQRKQNK